MNKMNHDLEKLSCGECNGLKVIKLKDGTIVCPCPHASMKEYQGKNIVSVHKGKFYKECLMHMENYVKKGVGG